MPSLRTRTRAAVLVIGFVTTLSGCGGKVPPTGTVVEEDLHLDDQEGPATKPSPKSEVRPR